ncbi:FAD/NAD-P-binding domain-containing protein [Pholiota conissans]|uniref:FAD/NAD-P-binding domain-containing protein n=1 Tax=Pholiota conissans TaxID=109636 RepID=A0A9P5YMB0_9AGAR|nr:FAD/NAD-P-binding domain-containing protein [Pholiota conissans]
MFNMAGRPNVVIVGAGGTGAQVARLLSSMLKPDQYNLLLVTARPYYTHLPAWVRMSVTDEGHLEDRAHITYNYTLHNGNGQFIIGKVASIATEQGDKPGVLTLESGETVEYSVLILTPGSIWEGPLNIPDTKKETTDHLSSWREKFKDAHDIVLVGGGAVACEYAGEIKDLWPEKKVTIVHSQNLLLNDAYPNYFRKDVATGLRKREVDIVLSDYVDDLEPTESGVIKTRNGKRIIADLVVPCRGPKPNTGFVTLVPGTLSETKHIRVSATLQVFNYPRIFAGGDAIAWEEQKQFAKYGSHASVIANNVVSVLKNKQPSSLYHGNYELICITNGREHGAAYWQIFWGPTFGDWVASTVKSKDLFISRIRKLLGLAS